MLVPHSATLLTRLLIVASDILITRRIVRTALDVAPPREPLGELLATAWALVRYYLSLIAEAIRPMHSDSLIGFEHHATVATLHTVERTQFYLNPLKSSTFLF